MKSLSSTIQWLRLGSRNPHSDEKYFFIRSPADTKSNTPPGYHVIDKGYSFSELRVDTFTNAELGDEDFKNNMQSLKEYLLSGTIVKRVRK